MKKINIFYYFITVFFIPNNILADVYKINDKSYWSTSGSISVAGINGNENSGLVYASKRDVKIMTNLNSGGYVGANIGLKRSLMRQYEPPYNKSVINELYIIMGNEKYGNLRLGKSASANDVLKVSLPIATKSTNMFSGDGADSVNVKSIGLEGKTPTSSA